MTDSPAQNQLPLRQQVHFLKQKLAYQQQLLDDERRITDDLLLNKNRAIEQLQQKLQEQAERFRLDRDAAMAGEREVGVTVLLSLVPLPCLYSCLNLFILFILLDYAFILRISIIEILVEFHTPVFKGC